MQSMVKPGSQAEQVGRLFLAAVVVVCLPALPFGTYLIYPFSILTTWWHEMGHGLTALLAGQQFERLLIYPNGSGVAESLLDADSGALTRALIAAGGPIAPVVAGAMLIIASAHQRLWRPALYALAASIFVSVILYVRSTTGVAVLPLTAALFVLIAWRASDGIVRFSLQFLGMLAALSMLRDFNYLFTEEAVIGGRAMKSDTGAIEAALILPHWFWAGLILLISAVIIGASLKYALSDKRRAPPAKLPANVLQFRKRD